MQPTQLSSLSAEKMQFFVAALAGLPPDEVRKAKVLYIRDAISEFKAMQASFSGFGAAQGCFAIIPLFWPILAAQRKMISAQMELAKERIRNAIDVWRSDLRGEHFELDGEEINV